MKLNAFNIGNVYFALKKSKLKSDKKLLEKIMSISKGEIVALTKEENNKVIEILKSTKRASF